MAYQRKSITAELLAPAGNLECLQTVLTYGADAVYLAGQEFGMRTASKNFSNEQLQQAVQAAHAKNVPVYVTCNTLPRNEELDRLPAFLEAVQATGADAIIVADFGVMNLVKQYAPKVDIHISTQAGIVNYAMANALYDMGAKRVVLARELTLEDIAQIRAKAPADLEIEAFVHGAMCMAFSGRCLLSSYLNGRDANRGDCSQPCRWQYALVEKKRPGEYMDITEDERGSYIFNSRDMCMIEHIPQLLDAGVTSLKIEGRAKSAYYAAVTVNAYRHALDAALQKQPLPDWVPRELDKISHRPYSTGFYLGSEPGQECRSGGYVREYDVIAVCKGMQNGMLVLEQRNRFFAGDIADVLQPGQPPFEICLRDLYDAERNAITAAPHATMTVLANCDRAVQPGAILRKLRPELKI